MVTKFRIHIIIWIIICKNVYSTVRPSIPHVLALICSAMSSDRYRVHKIFNSEKLRVADKLQDRYLFKFVGYLCLFDLVVLIGWTAPDSLQMTVPMTIPIGG